jgi:hypothetical protein
LEKRTSCNDFELSERVMVCTAQTFATFAGKILIETFTYAVRLDLGYIAVRNEMGVDAAEALALETDLFITHPVLCEQKPHERG